MDQENNNTETNNGTGTEGEKVFSLKDILNQKTEEKPESKPEPPPTPEATPADPKPEEKKYNLNPEAVATNLIDLLDGAQQLALPFVYQFSLFNRTERGILKQIARTAREAAKKANGKTFTVSYSEEEGKLLEDFAEYEEYCNELPFSEKEVLIIKKPLVGLIEETKFGFSAKGALLGSVFLVMAPRTIPLLFKKVGQMFGIK